MRKIEKKVRTVQSKQSQGGNISPIWGIAPTAPIETKSCMVGHLADVIAYAKFQDDQGLQQWVEFPAARNITARPLKSKKYDSLLANMV